MLTQLEFPLLYTHIVWAGELTIPSVLVLTLRNVLLIRLTWIAARRVLHQTGQDDTPEESAAPAATRGRVG